jgi:hypothetical protein
MSLFDVLVLPLFLRKIGLLHAVSEFSKLTARSRGESGQFGFEIINSQWDSAILW